MLSATSSMGGALSTIMRVVSERLCNH